jgi:hypothetical protein
MKEQKAFLIGIHPYSFREGEPAEIIGVSFCTPDGLEERLCYKIRYNDGKEDFVAVSDTKNYKIINETDAKEVKIPKVTP